jgi:hypothetical protein
VLCGFMRASAWRLARLEARNVTSIGHFSRGA